MNVCKMIINIEEMDLEEILLCHLLFPKSIMNFEVLNCRLLLLLFNFHGIFPHEKSDKIMKLSSFVINGSYSKENRWLQCRWWGEQFDLPVSFPCCSGRCRWRCPSTLTQSWGRTHMPSPPLTTNTDTPSSACCGGWKHKWGCELINVKPQKNS